MKIPKISFKFTNETIVSEQPHLTVITHVPNMQSKHDQFVERAIGKQFNTEEKMLHLISFLIDSSPSENA